MIQRVLALRVDDCDATAVDMPECDDPGLAVVLAVVDELDRVAFKQPDAKSKSKARWRLSHPRCHEPARLRYRLDEV